MIEFGEVYMAQIVRNSQALGAALHKRGIPVLGAHKGFSRTHQVIADVRQFGGGYEVARRLERANIITNKNLIPSDTPADWDHPGGLRMGTIEATRLGMNEQDMDNIANFISRVLVDQENPESVGEDAIDFRQPYQKLYYCFENGKPANNP
jgi:glycine hydroxymethyltransferase